ncbi:hypothetical protein LLR47_19675 [Bacillus cereus]|uniref:hypothetical protein n=1 Tax=Bacillus cereus TaxID=1396 RepID=UPI001D1465B6|nr:hypothetical protein [Bacillus cereus]MCC3687425.1 hypothetical protein [Bacillus cereus]
MEMGSKIGSHQVIINASSEKSAQAIMDEILKEMPFLDGAITIKEPQEVKPLSKLIEEGKVGKNNAGKNN